MGQSLAIPRVIPEDWKRLDLIINKIKIRLGRDADIAFANLTLSDLVASRLIATDSGKTFESVADLTAWIVGTENQIVVSVLAGGKVTLSTPQDIHTDAQVEFAGLTIRNGSGNVIFHVNHDELYFTECPTDPVTGNPIGLLLALTYTA